MYPGKSLEEIGQIFGDVQTIGSFNPEEKGVYTTRVEEDKTTA